jgi:hypothetical protein
MPRQVERDFPLGHPKAADTVIGSPEHLAWLREYDTSRGERDFPVDHPKAADTPGNLNHVQWEPGVDPFNPHLQAFTGRTPEKAEAVATFDKEASARAKESPALEPVDARRANAALAAKRRELGVETLTQAQMSEVLAELQKGQ